MIRTGPPELFKPSWNLLGPPWRAKNQIFVLYFFAILYLFSFFGPETQLVVSKRFHLTIYRVLHEESESELKNDQILQPYAAFWIFRTLKIISNLA